LSLMTLAALLKTLSVAAAHSGVISADSNEQRSAPHPSAVYV